VANTGQMKKKCLTTTFHEERNQHIIDRHGVNGEAESKFHAFLCSDEVTPQLEHLIMSTIK
jgi:hypothetical protein